MNDPMGVIALLVMLSAACLSGPRILIARRLLILVGARSHRKQLGAAVLFGLQLGIVAACILASHLYGTREAAKLASLLLLILIAAADCAWRWIPQYWAFGLFLGALVQLGSSGEIFLTFLTGFAIGAGLFSIGMAYKAFRGVEGVGFGDVTLLVALSPLVGAERMMLLPVLACLLTLVIAMVSRFGCRSRRKRFGEPFGASLCVTSMFFLHS